MTFASMSDVGGVGFTTEEMDGTQGAGLVATVHGMLTSARTVKVSPISHFMEKCQAEEKSVQHVGGRDPCNEPGRGRGGLAPSGAEVGDVTTCLPSLRWLSRDCHLAMLTSWTQGSQTTC